MNITEFSFEKGKLKNLDTGEERPFQFNPTSIKESIGVNYAITNPIQAEQPLYQHINAGERVISFQLFLNGLEEFSGNTGSLGPKKGILGELGLNTGGQLASSTDRIASRGLESAVGLTSKLLPFAEASNVVGKYYDSFVTQPARPKLTRVKKRHILEDMTFLEDLVKGRGAGPPPRIQFKWTKFFRHVWIMTSLSFNTNMFDKELNPLHTTVDITLKRVLENGSPKKEPSKVLTDSGGTTLS